VKILPGDGVHHDFAAAQHHQGAVQPVGLFLHIHVLRNKIKTVTNIKKPKKNI
jgi:hypothetical protein